MQFQRRALYNLLRMNWLLDPSIAADAWQIADYRAFSLEDLLGQLANDDVHLDRRSFLAFAETCDSPEELCDHLLSDRDDLTVPEQDRIFLVLFELWRRLLPERICVSVFCDELDHQINLYDRQQVKDQEALQDVIGNLQEILNDNTDQGIEPEQAFQAMSEACANNLEGFLYDFINDQIDQDNLSYATDLIDGFYDYVDQTEWLYFLKARTLMEQDPAAANEVFHQLIQETQDDPDKELWLEILAFMVEGGERELFIQLVEMTLNQMDTEEDFQDLLSICQDFYQRLDYDREAETLQVMMQERKERKLDSIVRSDDLHRAQLLELLRQRAT